MKKAEAKKTLELLELVKSIRPTKQRATLLKYLNEEGCERMYQTVANVLKNSKLDTKKREKLKCTLLPHKNTLRYLAKKSKSKSLKKRKLEQLGGFPLTAILTTAIPLLIEVVRHFSK